MNHKIISKITSGALLCTMFAYTTPVFAYTKEETVYSKLDANGSNYNTIVNSHIENEEGEEIINDLSDLLNIKNVNGEEEVQQEGNNLVWEANGSDIYYQGESQKELPIECKVSYELDGKEITANELAGKSGKVKIKIEYINKAENMININGKDEILYTPFVVVCGTIIHNDKNKNIEITNGKAIDDGSKTTVVGISLPGLQESLGISKSQVEIPNTIEITMDATDFELNNIVTYVTPKVIEESDMNLLDKIDKIYGQIDTLQNASNSLEEGANTLKEGTNTYREKSQEFNQAMNQVAEGTSLINSNYDKIDSGISSVDAGSSSIQSGAEQLNAGMNELSSELTKMPEGIETLYNANTQVLAGLNGSDGLVEGVNNLITSFKTTTGGLEDALTLVASKSEEAIKDLKANNQALQTAIEALPEGSTAIATLQAQIEANKKEIATYEGIKTAVNNQKASVQQQANASEKNLANMQTGMATLQGAVTQINGGLGQLNAASEKLPDALTQLTNGSKALTNGSKTLVAGTKSLNQGSTQLKAGMQSLDDNTKKLAGANDQLTDGAITLSEGATTLAQGMSQFNKDGIQTICNYINGDLKNVSNRLEKLQELSENYQNFTMLNNGNKGNVKFIMIMDSVRKEENAKQEIIVEDKKGE